MKRHARSIAAGLVAVLLAFPGAASIRAQSFNDDQRNEIERIVKEYLLSHPELLQDVMTELEKRQTAADVEKQLRLRADPQQIAGRGAFGIEAGVGGQTDPRQLLQGLDDRGKLHRGKERGARTV